MAHPREGNEKNYSTYNMEKKIPILEQKKHGFRNSVAMATSIMTYTSRQL